MKFGSYDLLGRLATGGYAHIFLAGERGGDRFDRLVCVKTLVPERARDSAFVNDFLAEARLASHLAHPNCVNIYDIGEEQSTPYISMEFIAGETVASLLSTWRPHDPLSVAPMLSIIASVCDGLHYAHELRAPEGHAYNLVHRDVSPQNIMVSYDGETKVVDFGVAKAEMEREDTRTGVIKGKVRYMSPEQITFGVVDRRSDIFSLGLVLFECLTGEQVFGGCSPPEVQYRLINESMPKVREFMPHLDAALEKIVDRALAVEGEERYPTADAMARDLRRYLEETGHGPGRLPIAQLMRERFGNRVDRRQSLIARLLTDDCAPAEIRAAFGARPVMALDIFGEMRMDQGRAMPVGGKLDSRVKLGTHSDMLDSFDEDATVWDPRERGPTPPPEGPTMEDADAPTTPTIDEHPIPLPSDAFEPRAPEEAKLKPLPLLPLDLEDDHPEFESESDDTRLLPDTADGPPGSFDSTDRADSTTPRRRLPVTSELPAETRPEATKKIDAREMGRRRSLWAVWLFGFVVGVAAGFAGAWIYLQR